MAVHEVVIKVRLEGVKEVTAGFRRMSSETANLSSQLKSYGRELASLGASAVGIARVGEQFGFLNKQQAETIREMGGLISVAGTVIRTMGHLAKASWALEVAEKARGAAHAFADTMAAGVTKIAGAITGALASIASSSWAVAIAEKARAVASAIAHGVSSLGLAVPVIVAAATAASIGVLAALGKIPGLQEGGIVYKPTVVMLGEREPEAVVPLSKFDTHKVFNVTNNYVTIEGPVFRSRSDMEYFVDRLKRMGFA